MSDEKDSTPTTEDGAPSPKCPACGLQLYPPPVGMSPSDPCPSCGTEYGYRPRVDLTQILDKLVALARVLVQLEKAAELFGDNKADEIGDACSTVRDEVIEILMRCAKETSAPEIPDRDQTPFRPLREFESRPSAELLPCPFCGGPAEIDGSGSVGYAAQCANGACLVGAESDYFHTPEKAANAWNKRSGKPA